MEADSMDPQHRMMIETTYEALEKAGLSLQSLAGSRTGVFMGHFTSDYREMILKDPESAPMYTATSTSKTSLANRISWLFDLNGPSFSMDTACSSSLVALHLACQSLRTGESDVAIVGGVNLLLNPEMFLYFSNQHFLSPDGKCKSFDISGNGYGRGEGIAALVLKRVDDAVSGEDPIRAIIRGTGSNQDGHTKGFTLPSADAQAMLIGDTYRAAGLGFQDTHYVEAHGTGTQAGDTEETTAISRTISAHRSVDNKLLIGSVKSNIGHLEACAGLAGIIKSVFILEHGMIPPTINHHTPNPKIQFNEWNLEVPVTLTPWPTSGVRRISVNSFGYGGTNAHAVLDDAYSYLRSRGLGGNHYTDMTKQRLHSLGMTSTPGDLSGSPNGPRFHDHISPVKAGYNTNLYPRGSTRLLPDSVTSGRPDDLIFGNSSSDLNGNNENPHAKSRLFLFSAADEEGLKRTRRSLAEYFQSKMVNPELDSRGYLASLAYTLSRKTTHQWKSFGVAASLEQLSEHFADDDAVLAKRSSEQPRIGFIFTGQGAQWPRMGIGLMVYAAFRESVNAADEFLRYKCNCSWSATEELMKAKSTSKLHLAEYSQTLCTVLQVAIVDLLRTWRIAPVAVAGHSSGEIGAAYCLGALTREDAWKSAYFRGVVSSALKIVSPGLAGSMMAIGASPEEAEEYISTVMKGEVVVACINSPTSATLSGDAEGIDELFETLNARGVFARKLKVDTAYHSPHMQIVAQDYFEAIADIVPRSDSGKCRMHSSVTGHQIEPSELGPVNWVRNLTSTVQFAAAVHDMLRPLKGNWRSEENTVDMLIEIGPHSALQGPAMQTLEAHGISNVSYQSVLLRDQDAARTALALAGAVFSQGGVLDILQVNNDSKSERFKVQPLVDLPAYTWNHDQSHWTESRVSKEYRQRKHPCRSLLGAPTPAFAQEEYSWRKFIKLSEEPWISDHVVQSSIVYPAAGFLAMVLEAAHQIADPDKKITGFRIRDVQLTTAAILSQDRDLEIMIQLRPHRTSTRTDVSTWMEFVINTSPDTETLARNCSGLIITEYESAQGSSMSQEKEWESEYLQARYLEAASLCKQHIVPAEFYESLTKIGLKYGATFTNVTEIRSTNGTSFCALDIPETPMRKGVRPHVIHPGTLDAMFHLAFAALQGGKNDLREAMVPCAIDEVFISADMPFKPETRLSGFSNADKHGFRELVAEILMFAEEKTHPVVRITGFTCKEIGASSSSSDDEVAVKKLTSKLVWKPAIELLSTEEKKRVLKRASNDDDNDISIGCRIENDEKAALRTIHEVLSATPSGHVLGKHKEWYNWMQDQIGPAKNQEHPEQDDAKRQLLARNGARIAAELTGGGADSASADSRQLINELYLQSESMKSILKQLSETADSVTRAQEQLVSFGEAVKFAAADDKQGWKDEKFDLVLSFNLTSTAIDPDIAIRNARQLLKEGGEVCLVEITRPGLYFQMLDKSQRSETAIPPPVLLSRNGLSNSFATCDTDGGQSPQVELLVACTKADANGHLEAQEVVIIEPPNASSQVRDISAQLSASFDEHAIRATSITWGSDVSGLKDKSCISLLEIERPLLQDLAESDFHCLKTVITDTREVFWVVGFKGPGSGIVNGLARVVRNEIPGLHFRTLIADLTASSSRADFGSLITRAFKSKSADDEFRIDDGIINVSRIKVDSTMNQEVQDLLPNAPDRIERMPLGKADGPQKLSIQTPGMLDSLCFESDNLPQTELEDDQIEIDVKATAINFREIIVALGQMPDKLFGFDAAGVVRRVGAEVTSFRVGDNVAMYGHGSHRTIHRSKASYCAPIPQGLSFEQAATIPLVHGTAWYGLVQLARVQKGQSILIHAAAGGVGQAAIQIAKYFDMEIFATVGYEVKRKLLRDEYNIPDDHLLNSRDLSFVQGIKRMTGGRGVDVVLNSLSGEALRQTWHCIASFGTFIEIGIRDILDNTELDMRPFLQDATYTFFNMNHIERERPETMAKIIAGTFDFQRRGITRPIKPLKTYPIAQVENAFRLMQAGKHIGKLALTFSDEDVVPILRKSAESFHLVPDAAYMIVGGFGGLGRSISNMLVDHGARKLAFLSRSGSSSTEAKNLIQQLQGRQVQVQAYACDIADPVATSRAIRDCTIDFAPIRGVIQSAMLLRDVLFTNMTYREWIESIRPKVQGTWNLHQNLKHVDFFVSLSSFAATFGNRGQANYAAGGAYQDALAYHRRSQGLRAVTLDVGLMRQIGVLAEKGITESLREWEEAYGILEPELHALLKRCISGDMNGHVAPQVLTGLATGGSAIAAGIPLPFYLEDNARFSIMAKTEVRTQSAGGGGGSGGGATEGIGSGSSSTPALVAKAGSIQEASQHITEALVSRLAKMLQTPEKEIDPSRFLHTYGIDSLTAIEIVNWALRVLKASISVIDVMAGVPMTTTARKIAANSGLYQGPRPAA
ncbi:MAG: hypothetical protein LQ352_005293 [Teloschistes flavicans]|nr:MAG: hypothetical protein LQ352_005293 [Teloschistes flavicans]